MTSKSIENTNAIFKIKNNQTFDDHSDCVNITTEGNFYFKNGAYYLLYKEYNDMGEISIMIRAKDDTVVIKRSGACNARMEYKKGLHQEVVYSIPFGDIMLDLDTDKVINKLDQKDGGSLQIKYKLTINHEAYINNLKIDVKIN